MASKDYLRIMKFTGTLTDLPTLGARFERLFDNFGDCQDEPEFRENYRGFVQVKNGRLLFWQGCGGEDKEFGYSDHLRFYEPAEAFCRALAAHLSDGVIDLSFRYEGDDPAFFRVTPGAFRKLDPFA